MSYTSSPPEQTYPARASRLHRSADKHEAEAERKRREANELDRKWAEYIAKRDAAKEQTA